MDHQTFVSRMKNALSAKNEGRVDDAAAELRTLLQDLEPAVRCGVNDWHQQQALGFLADVLDAPGKVTDCRAAWREYLDFTEQATTYWQKSLSSARANFETWNVHHPSQEDRP